jgi:hypothetical protein
MNINDGHHQRTRTRAAIFSVTAATAPALVCGTGTAGAASTETAADAAGGGTGTSPLSGLRPACRRRRSALCCSGLAARAAALRGRLRRRGRESRTAGWGSTPARRTQTTRRTPPRGHLCAPPTEPVLLEEHDQTAALQDIERGAAVCAHRAPLAHNSNAHARTHQQARGASPRAARSTACAGQARLTTHSHVRRAPPAYMRQRGHLQIAGTLSERLAQERERVDEPRRHGRALAHSLERLPQVGDVEGHDVVANPHAPVQRVEDAVRDLAPARAVSREGRREGGQGRWHADVRGRECGARVPARRTARPAA